jgi:hypothetical protein
LVHLFDKSRAYISRDQKLPTRQKLGYLLAYLVLLVDTQYTFDTVVLDVLVIAVVACDLARHTLAVSGRSECVRLRVELPLSLLSGKNVCDLRGQEGVVEILELRWSSTPTNGAADTSPVPHDIGISIQDVLLMPELTLNLFSHPCLNLALYDHCRQSVPMTQLRQGDLAILL